MFDQTIYDERKDEFLKIAKKISNYSTRPLPTETEERNERVNVYVGELIVSYNSYITYVREHFTNFNEKSKQQTKEKVSEFKLKILKSLNILGLETDLPENFDDIENNKIVALGTLGDTETVPQSTVFVPSANDRIGESSNGKTIGSDKAPNANDNQFSFVALVDGEDKMVQSFVEFMNIATKTINFRYNGDPLQLRTFINKAKLLDRATEQENKGALVEYIISCLEGKALEVIPENAVTLQAIIDALSDKIKFENAMVIEGRLMALRADQNKLNDFATKAEAVSDELIRALTLKRIPHDVATEMAVEKTIELCQLNAHNGGIRQILSSVKFDTPKEVVSKYIIECRKQVEQKQILQCHKQNFNRGNNRPRFDNNSNRQGNFHNNQSDRGNFNNNFRGNFRGNYRGNFRGRGRGRGNWHGNNGQNGQERRNVYYAENSQAPPPGAQNQRTVPVNQADN